MSENDYSALYKSWPTARLLEIVDNAQQFQPSAVEAAKHELERRQLSDEQLDTERSDNVERQTRLDEQTRSASAVFDKLNGFIMSFAGIFRPVQDEGTVNARINLILVVLAGRFLFSAYQDFDFIVFIFTNDFGEYLGDVVIRSVYYFSAYIILPAAGIFIWLRQKFGWVLTAFYFTYIAVRALFFLYYSIVRLLQDNRLMEAIFPVGRPGLHLVMILIFGGSVWILTTEDLRKAFNVNRQAMIMTIGAGAVVPILEQIVYQFL